MRSGRCSSSSASPTESCRASARSPSRSAIPKTKSTVAQAPSETPESPCSTLCKVVLLIEARSARIATGMRRLRRASRMSCPSFLSTRVTGLGFSLITSTILHLILFFVHYHRLYPQPNPDPTVTIVQVATLALSKVTMGNARRFSQHHGTRLRHQRGRAHHRLPLRRVPLQRPARPAAAPLHPPQLRRRPRTHR